MGDLKDTSLEQKMPTNQPTNLLDKAFSAGHFVGASTSQNDAGTFNGGSYRISHSDSNTVLTVQLATGCPLTVKSGRFLY